MRFNEGTPIEQLKARWPKEMIIHLNTFERELIDALDHTYPKLTLNQFLNNQPVLSLGCGSPISTEEDHGRSNGFEAWFPRLCWIYGAKPILGVDLFAGDPKDGDIYDHQKTNIIPLLLQPDKMFSLPGYDSLEGKTAVVEAKAVFGWGKRSSPTFLRKAEMERIRFDDMEDFEILLTTGLYKIAVRTLKEGGLLFLNYDCFVYKKGQLFLVYSEERNWLKKPEPIYPIAH